MSYFYLQGMELLDGEMMESYEDEVEIVDSSDEEGEEENITVTSDYEIDMQIDKESETPANQEIHNTFAEDSEILARIEDFVNAEKIKSSTTLLPFFVSVNNSLKQARLSLRKREAVDETVVKEIVGQAKKRKKSEDNA